MGCDTKDFRFPMQAEIYYPMIEQSPYGNTSKTWGYDRTVPCNFQPAGPKEKEEMIVNINMRQDSLLLARFRSDIRESSFGELFSTNNILVTNVKDRNCNEIYIEAGGPRNGKSTLFEVATFQPFVNPFGAVEYYKIILRRSENQEFDV
jgi:hypothetical protein